MSEAQREAVAYADSIGAVGTYRGTVIRTYLAQRAR